MIQYEGVLWNADSQLDVDMSVLEELVEMHPRIALSFRFSPSYRLRHPGLLRFNRQFSSRDFAGVELVKTDVPFK